MLHALDKREGEARPAAGEGRAQDINRPIGLFFICSLITRKKCVEGLKTIRSHRSKYTFIWIKSFGEFEIPLETETIETKRLAFYEVNATVSKRALRGAASPAQWPAGQAAVRRSAQELGVGPLPAQSAKLHAPATTAILPKFGKFNTFAYMICQILPEFGGLVLGCIEDDFFL